MMFYIAEQMIVTPSKPCYSHSLYIRSKQLVERIKEKAIPEDKVKCDRLLEDYESMKVKQIGIDKLTAKMNHLEAKQKDLQVKNKKFENLKRILKMIDKIQHPLFEIILVILAVAMVVLPLITLPVSLIACIVTSIAAGGVFICLGGLDLATSLISLDAYGTVITKQNPVLKEEIAVSEKLSRASEKFCTLAKQYLLQFDQVTSKEKEIFDLQDKETERLQESHQELLNRQNRVRLAEAHAQGVKRKTPQNKHEGAFAPS